MITHEQKTKELSVFCKLHEETASIKLEYIVDREAISEALRLVRLKELGMMGEDPMEHAVQNWRSVLFRYQTKVKDCFKKKKHV